MKFAKFKGDKLNIGDLELLRKKTLKEIDNQKRFVILGAITFGVLVWLFHHSDFFIAKILRLAIYLPIAGYIFDEFKLEQIKQKSANTIYKGAVLLAMLIISAVTNNFPRLFNFVIAIFIVIDMILIYKLCMKSIKNSKQGKFKKAFKEQFLKPYFAELGYGYQNNGMINIDELFKNSKLFAVNIAMLEDIYKQGNDEIQGEHEGVRFHLFDTKLIDTFDNYVIYGVFFVAEFNKITNSDLFIASKEKQYDDFYGYKQITMDDNEFNSYFSVYSNDIQNAMYILSPAFMKRLLDLKKRLKMPLTVSFIENKIYIFLDTGKDNFEPNIDKSVLRANSAFAIKMELSQFLSIIKTLNLNTKIWKI